MERRAARGCGKRSVSHAHLSAVWVGARPRRECRPERSGRRPSALGRLMTHRIPVPPGRRKRAAARERGLRTLLDSGPLASSAIVDGYVSWAKEESPGFNRESVKRAGALAQKGERRVLRCLRAAEDAPQVLWTRSARPRNL